MRDDDIAIVRGIPLFSSLSDEQLQEMLQMAYLLNFPPQIQLIQEGDPADFLHVVVEGTVELCGHLNGRETTMLVIRPISTFSLASILRGDVYLMTARTLQKTRILMIPADHVRKAMEDNADFVRALLMELANRYRSVMRGFKEQKLRSGMERLANYLLRVNQQTPGKGQVLLTEDKRTLAALMGMTPEYLSRAFKSLREHGVEVKGNNIRLTSLAALKRLAQPNPLIDDREI